MKKVLFLVEYHHEPSEDDKFLDWHNGIHQLQYSSVGLF